MLSFIFCGCSLFPLFMVHLFILRFSLHFCLRSYACIKRELWMDFLAQKKNNFIVYFYTVSFVHKWSDVIVSRKVDIRLSSCNKVIMAQYFEQIQWTLKFIIEIHYHGHKLWCFNDQKVLQSESSSCTFHILSIYFLKKKQLCGKNDDSSEITRIFSTCSGNWIPFKRIKQKRCIKCKILQHFLSLLLLYPLVKKSVAD